MPTKTSINLVIKKEKFLSTRRGRMVLIAGIVIGCLLVALLIVRPIVTLTRANSNVAKLQSELDEANKSIESMNYIEEDYAHYTTEGLSAEELSRVNRVKVMKLVEDAVLHSGAVRGWSIEENVMSLEVSGASLAELNQIAAALEQEDLVERCVINTANRGSRGTDNSRVAVTFIVYLNPADGLDLTPEGNTKKAKAANEA